MKQARIFIVRHGESHHNRSALLGGHVDTPLTETGRQQAKQTAERLQHIEFDKVYSSDLQRAADTVEIIYGRPVPPSNRLPKLRERDWGSLNGKPNSHIAESEKVKQAAPRDKAIHHKYVPDMESDYEVGIRFIETLKGIAERNPDKTILIGSHGGMMRSMLMLLQDLDYVTLPMGSVRNAGHIELIYRDGDLEVIEVDVLKK